MKRYSMRILFSSLFCLGACSSPQIQNVNVQMNDLPNRIIDAHIHSNFNQEQKEPGIPNTQAELIHELSESHISAAISMNARDGGGWISLPTSLIINCVGIALPFSAQKIEARLKNKTYRCIKIYLGYVHAFAYDKAYLPLYSLAEKYNVPVIFHTGDTYLPTAKLKYADPLTIDEVAVDHPRVTFVIAHIGNPWIQSAAEVAYKNENVYLDGSGLMVGLLANHTQAGLERYVLESLRYTVGFAGARKLMFGTDWPFVSIKDYIAVFKQAIPKEKWDDVFYKNARRIFHLSELPE